MAQEAQKTKGLVPDNFEDFRSLQFWDGFFDTRGDKPFEWYGDWRQLQSFLKPLCTPQTEVLMAGCGNSELSAELCVTFSPSRDDRSKQEVPQASLPYLQTCACTIAYKRVQLSLRCTINCSKARCLFLTSAPLAAGMTAGASKSRTWTSRAN